MSTIGEHIKLSAKKPVVGMVAVALAIAGTPAFADNPIVQTCFTADPAPLVHNDTVYLYAGHDEDDAIGFKMFDWKVFTSTDMVNWTDRGVVASTETFSWGAKNGAWASQCIERNGKFYFYCTVAKKPGGIAIGVAVADNPLGPFKDALGKPIVSNSPEDIDPSVFIDDDGQAYMYWGNPNVYYVKLNEDMISYSGEIVKATTKPRNYQEGPWFYKRDGKYYLAYASTCCPEGIGYGMSDSPTGPWEYKGMIMDPDGASSGNHPGIIDYKGSTYAFGFNYQLSRVGVERRSICVERMTYNPDGTIQKLPFWTLTGVPQVGRLDPFVQNEAATICWSSGLKTRARGADKAGVYLTDINNGDYVKVKGVDFGETGAGTLVMSLASGGEGGTIDVRLNSPNGRAIATVVVPSTGSWETWQSVTTPVNGARGVHDLYFVFKGNAGSPLFNVDNWQFRKH